MKIELSQEEFETLHKHSERFRRRIYEALQNDSGFAAGSAIDELVGIIEAHFGGLVQSNKMIPAIKYLRDYVGANFVGSRTFRAKNGIEHDVSSLSGAKKFVEDYCIEKDTF